MKLFSVTLLRLLSITVLFFALNPRLFGQDINDFLDKNYCTIQLRMNQFDPDRFNRSIVEQTYDIDWSKAESTIEFQNSSWKFQPKFQLTEDGKLDLEVKLLLVEGELPQSAPSIDFIFQKWSVENYVLLPGAAYNGNRFESRRIRYSPKLMDPRDYGPNNEAIVSDIPKLNNQEGPSRIQERSGSMTTPSLGFFSPSQGSSFWMLFPQANQWGDFGVNLEENRNRSKMTISLSSPVVREYYKYRIADNRYPTDDIPPNFKKGDEVNFKMQLQFFPSQNIAVAF